MPIGLSGGLCLCWHTPLVRLFPSTVMGTIMFCVNEIYAVRCNGSGHEYICKIMRYSKHVLAFCTHHAGKYFNIYPLRTDVWGRGLLRRRILMKLQIILVEYGLNTVYWHTTSLSLVLLSTHWASTATKALPTTSTGHPHHQLHAGRRALV